LHVVRESWTEEEDPAPRTTFLRDASRSIVARNDSPDVGFDLSVNPYRGCEHGCAYCYARPTHEYLGFSAGLDFESKILVKEDAPELLRAEMLSPRWVPEPVAMSGVTDPYQPVERRLGITRRCLEQLAEFRNPVLIVTKSRLVTRDADILGEMAKWDGAVVFVSLTTLDHGIQRAMEPRASSPARRLSAVEALASAGVPVGIMMAPLVPGLNDREIPAVLKAARDAGAGFATHVLLRLPLAVAPIFERWLGEHFPDRKKQVLSKIRAMRGGKLNDGRFGHRMRGRGAYAAQLGDFFEVAKRKAGFEAERPRLSTACFRRPGQAEQLGLGI
jgi:DNA repair photolyase